mgnify:CR=1 FL=1
MKHDNHDSLRHDMTHVGPHDVFDDLLGQSLGQVLVQRVHEAVGVEPRFVRADEHGQILGHLTAFNGVDDDLLQRLGEVTDFGRAVQIGAVLKAAGPREDGCDWVGGGLLALLPAAVVTGHGAVRRFGLDGLAVRGHEHGGHEAQRTEALGHGVGLHIAIVVLAGPDVTAVPLQGAGHHVVDQAVLVSQAGLGVPVLVFGLEHLGKDVLELAVVGLQNRVLGGQVHRGNDASGRS